MAPKPNQDETMTSESRRAFERVTVQLSGSLRSSLDENYTKMMMANLSLGGAFIRTAYPLEKGAHVQLKLPSPRGEGTLEIEGEVVWTQLGEDLSGMGIRFLSLPDADKTVLRDLLMGFHQG